VNRKCRFLIAKSNHGPAHQGMTNGVRTKIPNLQHWSEFSYLHWIAPLEYDDSDEDEQVRYVFRDSIECWKVEVKA
jgi:hypothetical protein